MLTEDERDINEWKFKERIQGPVKMVLFTQLDDVCPHCSQTKTLLQEIAGLNQKISLEVYDYQRNLGKAKALGVDKTPGIAILGAKDCSIHIYGTPHGLELRALLLRAAIADCVRASSMIACVACCSSTSPTSARSSTCI